MPFCKGVVLSPTVILAACVWSGIAGLCYTGAPRAPQAVLHLEGPRVDPGPQQFSFVLEVRKMGGMT